MQGVEFATGFDLGLSDPAMKFKIDIAGAGTSKSTRKRNPRTRESELAQQMHELALDALSLSCWCATVGHWSRSATIALSIALLRMLAWAVADARGKIGKAGLTGATRRDNSM
jgi:hypothetical protein